MQLNIPPDKILNWIAKNFEYKRRGDGEIVIANPFHHNDNMKFNISLSKGVCHDWRGDDWAGPPNTNGKRNCSFIKFVKLYLNVSYPAAVAAILGDGCDPSQYLTIKKTIEDDEVPDEVIDMPKGSKTLIGDDGLAAGIVRKWLHKRGVTDRMIEKYDLHYISTNCVWPYYEFGQLVYWQSRSAVDKDFQFPPVPKSDYLYGYDFVDSASYIVLTESIFDAITINNQSVALGGLSLSNVHIRKIKLKNPVRGIILALDADPAGISAIISHGNALKQRGFKVCYSIPTECKDWNDYGQMHGFSKVREAFDNNIKLLDTAACVKLRQRVMKSQTPTLW